LIIPEPFFVHSDLTTMVQIADILAYIISWGLKLPGMTEPRREELEPLVHGVVQLRFRLETPAGHTKYGFKVIPDLRASNGQ
jgi:sulfur transfer protein SufE